jgi:uncharacterized oligopeptide transporter (OPT) family protein
MTDQAPPELTLRAIVLAIILAVILAAANAYLGLFAGMTIASAIPAAVVSMAVLKMLGGGHILENNIVATGASAGTSIATGVIFTIPALILLGYWVDFRYTWVLAIAGLGGLLGVLFSVPLRRSLIVDQKLAFPEGKAAAEVLRTGDRPGEGLKILAGAAALGGVIKLAAGSGLRLIPDTASVSTWFDKTIGYFGTNLSPALFGVGYIVGLNIGVVMLAGGAIAWLVAIPIYSTYFLAADPVLSVELAGASAEDAAYAIWSTQVRFLGVGAMLIGGVWTLFSLRKSLVTGIKAGLMVDHSAGGAAVPATERDLPMRYILIGTVVFVLPLLVLYQAIVGQWTVSFPMTIIMIVAGFLFVSVSAYMAGIVGSSNNPVSGLTIATILFAALVLAFLLGRDSPIGILGATPWKQQVMLAVGGVSSAFIMAPVLSLLAQAYGIGVPTESHPNPLLAPQANLMASVAKGIFGGELPWTMIGIGAGIGAVIIALDEILKKSGAAWRSPVLACAVGIYLPIELSVPIFAGGFVAYLVERRYPPGDAEGDRERIHQKGTLFSAGLITGEALMGIFIAIPIVVVGSAEVLTLPEGLHFGGWLGLLMLAVVAVLLHRIAMKQNSTG